MLCEGLLRTGKTVLSSRSEGKAIQKPHTYQFAKGTQLARIPRETFFYQDDVNCIGLREGKKKLLLSAQFCCEPQTALKIVCCLKNYYGALSVFLKRE